MKKSRRDERTHGGVEPLLGNHVVMNKPCKGDRTDGTFSSGLSTQVSVVDIMCDNQEIEVTQVSDVVK